MRFVAAYSNLVAILMPQSWEAALAPIVTPMQVAAIVLTVK
jgi:hypothetical protein